MKEDVYNDKFVENLFDQMSSSYDRMNYITSFGFSKIWRYQATKAITNPGADVVVDLLTGMGECWSPIVKYFPNATKIIALDFSFEMIQHSKKRISKFPRKKITTLHENVFNNSINSNIADSVVSGFGLKTFNSDQLQLLSKEIHRILKTNGTFSLIDVSVPSNKVLCTFYMFYLTYIIPILGRIFLGNPEAYRMLGKYTTLYRNSKEVKSIFEKNGFEVQYISYFFGCATGIKGFKA